MITCTSCGTSLPDHARFCSTCASPVAAGPAPGQGGAPLGPGWGPPPQQPVVPQGPAGQWAPAGTTQVQWTSARDQGATPMSTVGPALVAAGAAAVVHAVLGGIAFRWLDDSLYSLPPDLGSIRGEVLVSALLAGVIAAAVVGAVLLVVGPWTRAPKGVVLGVAGFLGAGAISGVFVVPALVHDPNVPPIFIALLALMVAGTVCAASGVAARVPAVGIGCGVGVAVVIVADRLVDGLERGASMSLAPLGQEFGVELEVARAVLLRLAILAIGTIGAILALKAERRRREAVGGA